MSKLPAADLPVVWQRYCDGDTLAAIAADYGCAESNISRRLRRFIGEPYLSRSAAFVRQTTGRKARPMTDRQSALLRYIIRAKTENGGDSPTWGEIMHATGYQSTSAVTGALNSLERRGLIERSHGVGRGGGRPGRIRVAGMRVVYEPPQEAAQ